MQTIKLDDKDYKVKATVGSIRKLFSRYDITNLDERNADVILNFYIEAIWRFLRPKYLFKPYITFGRFSKQVDIEDIRNCSDVILPMIYGTKLDDKDIGEKKKSQ